LRVPLDHKLLQTRRASRSTWPAQTSTLECAGYLSHVANAAQVKMRKQCVTFFASTAPAPAGVRYRTSLTGRESRALARLRHLCKGRRDD
jgi:hypothetical protein